MDSFATTRWSIVLNTRYPSSTSYRESLEILCQTYWYPLYAYLRRSGCTREQSEDHVQAFFARMLEKEDFSMADPGRGKFRSFLLMSLKHFVANENKKARAEKRGGGAPILTLDFDFAENLYAREPAAPKTPDKLFEYSWALAVLDQAMAGLEEEARVAGKLVHFTKLRSYLTAGKNSIPYREVADELEMTEGAVKVAVHRLRKRYRQLLLDEIAYGQFIQPNFECPVTRGFLRFRAGNLGWLISCDLLPMILHFDPEKNWEGVWISFYIRGIF